MFLLFFFYPCGYDRCEVELDSTTGVCTSQDEIVALHRNNTLDLASLIII
jgi:hypothetical protein